MKYTLLQLVQTIASSMNSDEVNSINDSVESLQIAQIVRSTYFDIIGRAKLPEHFSLVTLDASGDSSKPTLMYIPSSVEEIQTLRYNCLDDASDPINMQVIDYLPLEDFLTRMYSLNTDDSNVESFEHTIGTNTFTILYYNDRNPKYYTTFDDSTLIFDGYNSAVESTLQKSKTLAYGKPVIPFSMADSFTPDLDEEQFPLLLNEAKSLAWVELKQAAHQIAERNSRRNWTHLQKNKFATQTNSDFDKLPNFGRK